jgi:VWFA-related protein
MIVSILCRWFLSPVYVALRNNLTLGSVSSVQVNVNRVLVPVVVRNRQGQTVEDLKKEDFTVQDNDQPRPISGFVGEQRRTGVPVQAAGGAAVTVTPNQPAVLPDSIVVLLIDDLHLNGEDFERAKR